MKSKSKFEKIKSIERLPDFSDEYVYDLEVDDLTHSFIANDILVHNSIYVQFDSAVKSIKGRVFSREEALALCVEIDRHRLSQYFDIVFEKYGKVFNTKNRLKFKLENLSEYGIWLKKKNYAIKVSYDPNPTYSLTPKEERYLIIKGLEPVKGSYPDWARKKLVELTEYIMEIGKVLNLERDIVPKLQAIKEEFMALSVDEIAFNFKIRIYHKYVESEEPLVLKKGISIYPRAAAYYNHLLLKTGLNRKYTPLREGDKIKFYYCATNDYDFDVFAYAPENYPSEIAPQLDREAQFFSLIVEPVNRLLDAMQLNSLDIHLKRRVEVITVKSKKELTDDQIYPLYVVDRASLEYVEIPQKFWKIIGNPELNVSTDDFPEYLSTITTYGLNSTIVPKFELQKYLTRMTKKKSNSKAKEIENNLN
jgi:hypothetical protein